LTAAGVFVLCIVLGLAAVAWRAKRHADAARTAARTEARAMAAALELEFDRAATAAEVLGALARQNNGAATNFQKLATELWAAHTNLATLELQPAGVVSSIVPRLGNERALGFNVLKDPASRAGAYAAIQSRALTLAGPLTLYHGEPGIVARVPLLQRGRDGRDYFWGFVAVSLRLVDALNRAKVDDLWSRGYSYVLGPSESSGQKASAFVTRGVLPAEVVQQPVRAHNLEFRLALAPRNGWLSQTRIALESLAVILLSALLTLLVNLLGSRRDLEVELSQSEQRSLRDSAELKQAQEECRAANEGLKAAQVELLQTQAALLQAQQTGETSRTELEQLRTALKRAESKAAELQGRLDSRVLDANEARETAEAELERTKVLLRKAESNAAELEARLDAAVRMARETDEAARAKLTQSQGYVAELQKQLDAANRQGEQAAKEAQADLERERAKLEKMQKALSETQARLDTAVGAEREAAAAARARQQQDQATIAEFQTRLQAANSATPVLSSDATHSPEPSIPASDSALTAAVASFPTPHSALRTDSGEVSGVEAAPANIPLMEAPAVPIPSDRNGTSDSATSVPHRKPRRTKKPSVEVAGETQAIEGGSPGIPETEPPTPPAPASSSTLNSTIRTAQADRQPSETQTPSPPLDPAEDSALRTDPVEPASAAAPKPAKVPKRKKSRSDAQIDLFETPPPATESAAKPLITPPAESPTQPPIVDAPAAELPQPQVAEEPPEDPKRDTQYAIRNTEHTPESTATTTALASPESPATIDAEPVPTPALRQFAEQHVNTPEKIRDALVQGDSPAAQRLLVALFAAAGGAEAGAVQKTATALARAIQDETDPGEIEFKWADLQKAVQELVTACKFAPKPTEEKPEKSAPGRRLSPTPPLDPAQLRKAVSLILPLLTDQDPGAKDCLKDNRTTFRSAFTPEAYVEFEQSVKANDFAGALDQLKKAAKRHGLSV
jgi:sensor domain CHASE-containing protein